MQIKDRSLNDNYQINFNIRLLSFFNSTLFKNILINLFEIFATKGLNFIVLLLITRQLPPTDYGIYSYIFALSITLVTIFDFKTNDTTIIFTSKHRNKVSNLFGYYLTSKCIISFLTCVLIIFFAKYFFTILLNKPELIKFILIINVLFLGESFLLLQYAYYQAVQRFNKRALISITRNVLIFFLVLILYFTTNLTLENVLYVFCVPLIITVFFVPKFLKFFKATVNIKQDKVILKEIFSYHKWIIPSSLSTALLANINILMIPFWYNCDKVGFYNSAVQLQSIFLIIVIALNRTILPKISSLNQEDIFPFNKKLNSILLPLCLVLVISVPFLKFLPVVVYGNIYSESGLIFQILLLTAILKVMISPLENTLLSIGKSFNIMLSKTIQLILIIFLNFIFLPKFGVYFAAINLLVINIIDYLVMKLFYIKEGIKK